ncbi:hypothetical protein C8R46DRAFT_1184793 [Mycena filopes]|nr:hypothetical protein C8R46DRAFT_1184793 [Mycena filopes]
MEATIDNTYGLLFISVLVSSSLYGAGVLQFWMYIRKYHSKDHLLVKSLVVAVLICDTCQQALLCHAALSTLMIELFFSCAIATLVQQFYCYRIYRIGNSLLLVAAVSMVSWASCVSLLIYSVKAVRLSFLADVITLKSLSIVANTLSAVADVTISVVLVLLLHTAKTGFKRSTDMINRLIVFTFNTGLPTSVCALVATICIAAFPNTFLYIFFFLLLGRLYTNSLLVTLNSREYIKSASQAARHDHFSLDTSRANTGRGLSRPQRDAITVRIETNTVNDLESSKESKGMAQ